MIRKVEQTIKKTLKKMGGTYIRHGDYLNPDLTLPEEEQAQGITEQLKVENTLKWVGGMNNIPTCVREIVDKEIIFQ